MEDIALIQPMQSWKLGSIGDTTAIGTGLAQAEGASLFKDVFKSAINNVKTSQLTDCGSKSADQSGFTRILAK